MFPRLMIAVLFLAISISFSKGALSYSIDANDQSLSNWRLDLGTVTQEASKAGNSGGNNNRFKFVLTHSLIAQANFGVGMPIAFGGTDATTLIASNLITLPVSIAGHLFYVRNREMSASGLALHQWTTWNALGLAYATPLSFIESWKSGFKTGAIISLVAYPAGVWAGGLLNESYEKSGTTLQSQMVGVTTHGILGGFLGTEIVVLSDHFKEGWRATFPILMGSSLGLIEGLIFHRLGNHQPEQHWFNAAGMVGGMAIGSGILMLADENFKAFTNAKLATSTLTIGAFAGYALFYFITKNMKASMNKASKTSLARAISINPFPQLDAVIDETSKNQNIAFRLKIPGINWTF